MSRGVSGRRVAALVLIAVGVVGVAVLVVSAVSSDSTSTKPTGSLATSLRAATPADAPFAGLTATNLAVGDRCLRTVIADTESERVEGLRRRSDLGSYDAMLFVFPEPSSVGFTMSTVPVALDIGFYDADGTRGSSRHMLPCPKAENQCPVYTADGTFSFALETLGGKLPPGSLSGCSPS
jgi:uncharacterized membrane protein (UPF0127 family)